ncbi:hypothetical protein [Enterococcus cecorum]|uniref:DUF5067 domain-containing protein n=1 Tax=Enterococcus cecorum DSM 20682 = ATCC 43198 TaxID=1121864 RepID=S1RR23_9ENTE|nr:hypothetical protein [Enterococcus cecorum]EOX18972.1 hypothetical protein I567_00726 [Enterococcus cecorum DSM 20682 = ATCC 43198]ESK61299.1 hypothetical protein OMO_01359 [Enterococcus cecorum DSM 20682 = ATCC 43198]OJG33653.1 hypothetical protein RT42_GL001923 [Enterococcus cecorum DSM 20682 = ATCC 43198]CAI3428312.1 lipoprotein [Enterococcus cecorum DSM 20682 = ATCC 43198]SQE56745.1 Uncharacterised protein [Enterococcus cecorum]
MKKKILSVTILCTSLLLVACGNQQENVSSSSNKENSEINKKQDSENSNKNSKEEKVESEDKTYGLNEEAFITDSQDNNRYSLKVLKATTALSETSDLYTSGKPQNTVEVTYEYKNYAVEEPMLVSVQFVHAFDKDGRAGSDQSMQSGQTEVNKGRSAQSTVWFVMPEEQTNENEIEIEYSDDFSLGFENKTIKFKVPLEH